MTMKFGFGQPLTRKEDDALLRGAGCYVADVAPAATLHAVVLRSPHAHARFSIHELDRVRAMPGVRLVLTAAEVAELGPLPTPGVLPGVDIKSSGLSDPGQGHGAPRRRRHRLCGGRQSRRGKRRRRSDRGRLAAAAARDRRHGRARAAARRAYGPIGRTISPSRPNWAMRAATKAAFAQAARTVELTIVNQRLVTNYMDTRGVIAEYDGQRYTLTLGSQGSHIIRDIICDDVLRIAARAHARGDARRRRRFRHQAVPLSRICAGRGRRGAHCASR